MINCINNYWVVTLSVELRLPKYKVRLFVISYPSPTVAVARELEVGVLDKQEGCLRVEDKTPPPVTICKHLTILCNCTCDKQLF